MNIIETHIEEMLISAEEAPDEDILSGYSILGILDNDRELLLADIIANTHPAMDAEAHDDLNSPTLEESLWIAQLLAAAPQMRQIIATLATEALQNDGCIAPEGAIAALNFLATLSRAEASDSPLAGEHS